MPAGVGALLAGLLLFASPSAGRRAVSAAGGGCGLATADRLVEAEHLGNAGYMPQPVAQVLCGPFLGAGSRGMVVSLAIPSCGGSTGWVLYRHAAAGWQKVYEHNGGASLAREGTRLRDWQGVLSGSDPHCLPSSYRSRLWHWNGRRMIHGPWHKSGPPPVPLPGSANA